MGQTFHLTVGLRSGLSTVRRKEQEYPIVGFNGIEETLSQHSENPQAASNIIQKSFALVRHTQVGALINPVIQPRSQDASTSALKVRKRDAMLPKGEATKVLTGT